MIGKFASLVKISHTIFAMPFAMVGFFYGYTSQGVAFDWIVLLKIVLCMLFARNTAMAFNRLADAAIDAKNPRTASREIPAGVISRRGAGWFVAINIVLFVVCASTINLLAGLLSPVALFVVMGYSYCKRFTSLAHLVLGMGLSIAPMGAYIAVSGEFSWVVAALSGAVMLWTAGFDIIYALQDRDFDIKEGLHSIPSKFTVKEALTISRTLHALSAAMLIIFAKHLPSNPFIWCATGLFIALMVLQHFVVTPTRTHRIAMAFGTINGVASLLYATLTIVGILR
ncbi:MAG: UbiA-like polyprenyltransferase [Rikenellaceae bacterium]